MVVGMRTWLLRSVVLQVWLQSESDVCAHDGACIPQRGARYYSCAIKAMVRDWRAKFQLALPFLWVQISPWEGHEAATSNYELPAMRLAQMASTKAVPRQYLASSVDDCLDVRWLLHPYQEK